MRALVMVFDVLVTKPQDYDFIAVHGRPPRRALWIIDIALSSLGPEMIFPVGWATKWAAWTRLQRHLLT